MLSLILGCLALLAAACGEDCEHTPCNTGIIKYYKELNCQPIQETGACCPSKFDCSGALANREANKCHLRGRSFNLGAVLTEEEIGDKCIADIRCSQRFGPEVSFESVSIECPELFEGPPPAGCVRLYTHDKCCSTGQHCANDTKTSPRDTFTCEHGGKSFVVGQKFWPEEKPCLACICQQGFDGTLKEPWCKEISCGIEIHYGNKIKEGCAPIHYGNSRCCPIGWRCPSDADTVVRSSEAAPARDASECVFGKLKLKVSDKLNSEKQCIECKCSLPPHVSCVQTGNC